MSVNKISRSVAHKHFIISRCLAGLFDNLECTEQKTKRVIERVKKRMEGIPEFFNYDHRTMTVKELKKAKRQIDIISEIYKDYFPYDPLVFHTTLMIIVDEAIQSIPITDKYKELLKNYKYLEKIMFTLYNHLDEANERKAQNWEDSRLIKAEFMSKKLLKVINKGYI